MCEQICVVDWMRKAQPHVSRFLFHIPNERKVSVQHMVLLKKMGLMPGAPDLFLAYPSGEYHGAVCEMKSKNGRLQPTQKEVLERLGTVGYATKVAYSADEAIEYFKDYIQKGISSSKPKGC